MDRHRTPGDVAAHFGVTLKTVRKWVSLGAPVGENSRGRRAYNLDEVQEWLEGRGLRVGGDPRPLAKGGRPSKAVKAAAAERAKKAPAKGKADEGGPAPSDRAFSATLREKEAKAALAEMTLAQRRGELVPREAVDLRIAQAIESVKVAMLGLRRKYQDHLAGLSASETGAMLDAIGREVLGLFEGNVSEGAA